MALGVEQNNTAPLVFGPRAEQGLRARVRSAFVMLRRGWIAPALLLAFWPAWLWYATGIVDRGEDPWSLLAMLAAAVFYLPGIVRSAAVATRGRIAGVLLVLCLYLLTYTRTPHLLGLCLALAALIVLAAGTPGRRVPNLGGIGLLVLSLPLFPSLQFFGGYPLRVLAARLALPSLHGLGFGVELRGMDLVCGGMVVSVDAPCSGIQMLWSGVFLASVLIAWWRLPFWRAVGVFGVTLIVVILGNALRMASLFCLEMIPPLQSDFTHAGIGLLIFALGCGVIVACAHRAERGARRGGACDA